MILDSRLPSGWRRIKVEDIVAPHKGSLVSGPFGSNISKKYFVESGIPVIRGNNLTLGKKKFIDEGFVFITKEKAHELRNCRAEPRDVIFTAAGTLGQVGIIPDYPNYPFYIISNKQLRLRCNSELANPLYIYYWFSTSEMAQTIANNNTGSSIPLITLGILRNLPINLPPLPTQRRIAEVLSAYDDLIENNTRRIRILEEMAQAIYREWFVHFRYPGHEGVKRIDSPLGPISEGWEVKELGKVTKINPSQIIRNQEPDFINYIDISSVSKGNIDSITPLSFSNAPGRARRIVQHGDIIWSTVRPNRKSYSIIINPPTNLIVSTGFAVIRPTDIPFSYTYFVTTTDVFADYLSNHATGSAYPAVNQGDFEQALIVIPHQRILMEFSKLTETILLTINNLSRKNINLRQQRDLLLPRLVSGEIAVGEGCLPGSESPRLVVQ